jgi:flagellar hook-associated protein 3 FlgL
VIVRAAAGSSATRALELRSELSRIKQYGVAAADAQEWLSTVHAACDQIVEHTKHAVSIITRVVAADHSEPVDDAVAGQFQALRDALLALANTSHDDRPVFGGTTGNFAAYTHSGTYIGDRGCVVRGIADDAIVPVSRCGMDVFGAPGNDDLFGALADIGHALQGRASGSALRDALDVVVTSVVRAMDVRADVERAQAQVRNAALAAASRADALEGELAALERVGSVSVERIATASATYQLAQLTIARIRNMTAFRFLR